LQDVSKTSGLDSVVCRLPGIELWRIFLALFSCSHSHN
jgi:hypothetical protein